MSNTIVQTLGIRKCVDAQGYLTDDTTNSLPAWVVTTGVEFQNGHDYVLGDVVYPVAGNADPTFEYVVTVAGTAAGSHPTWPVANDGDTVTSGGVTFTAHQRVEVKYYNHGALHRADNLPAHIHANGNKSYYVNGQLHRTDGPADAGKYYLNGVLIDPVVFANVQSILDAAASESTYGIQFSVSPPASFVHAVNISPSVKVEVRDGNGVLDTVHNEGATVTVVLEGPHVLSGTKTQPIVAGVATFNDLQVDLAGTGMRLVAISALSSGTAAAESNTFNVT